MKRFEGLWPVMDAVVKMKYPQSAEHDWDGYDDLVQGALADMVADVRARVEAIA